jgi:hypothetical protein
MTASARQRSKGVPRLPKPIADSSSFDYELATAAVAGGPFLLRRARWGRRPQRPGNQARSTHAFWNVLRQFTLENRRLPLALPQSFGELRKSRFAELTLRQIVAPRNTKKSGRCAEAVEDETFLWKTEENLERILLGGFRLLAGSIT